LGDAVAPEDDGGEASCNDGEKKCGGYGVFHGAVLSTKDAPPSAASLPTDWGCNLIRCKHPEDRRAADLECSGNVEQSRPRRPGNPGQCREVTTLVADVRVSQPDGGDLQPDNRNRPAAIALWTKGKGGLSCASGRACAVQLSSLEKSKRWPYGMVLLGRKLNRGLN
jgi:hypothetical protein